MQIHEKSNSNRTSEFQEALISLKTHFGIFVFHYEKTFLERPNLFEVSQYNLRF